MEDIFEAPGRQELTGLTCGAGFSIGLVPGPVRLGSGRLSVLARLYCPFVRTLYTLVSSLFSLSPVAFLSPLPAASSSVRVWPSPRLS